MPVQKVRTTIIVILVSRYGKFNFGNLILYFLMILRNFFLRVINLRSLSGRILGNLGNFNLRRLNLGRENLGREARKSFSSSKIAENPTTQIVNSKKAGLPINSIAFTMESGCWREFLRMSYIINQVTRVDKALVSERVNEGPDPRITTLVSESPDSDAAKVC